MGHRWFVVFCRANNEIRATVNLANQFQEAYLPRLEGKPLFPRYAFVRFDRDMDPWGKIANTRGCIQLLKNGNIPTPVPDTVMDAIKTYCEENATRATEKAQDGKIKFKAGDAVVIQSGPLQGLSGLFVADKKARVSCLLELCGRRVEVPLDSVRAA